MRTCLFYSLWTIPVVLTGCVQKPVIEGSKREQLSALLTEADEAILQSEWETALGKLLEAQEFADNKVDFSKEIEETFESAVADLVLKNDWEGAKKVALVCSKREDLRKLAEEVVGAAGVEEKDNAFRMEQAGEREDVKPPNEFDLKEMWKQRGDLLKRVGRIEEARECYERGLEIKPSDLTTRIQLASELAFSNDPEIRDPASAMAHASILLEQTYGLRSEVFEFLAAAYVDYGRLHEAVEVLTKSFVYVNDGPSFKRLIGQRRFYMEIMTAAGAQGVQVARVEEEGAKGLHHLPSSLVGNWRTREAMWLFAADGTYEQYVNDGTTRSGTWTATPEGKIKLIVFRKDEKDIISYQIDSEVTFVNADHFIFRDEKEKESCGTRVELLVPGLTQSNLEGDWALHFRHKTEYNPLVESFLEHSSKRLRSNNVNLSLGPQQTGKLEGFSNNGQYPITWVLRADVLSWKQGNSSREYWRVVSLSEERLHLRKLESHLFDLIFVKNPPSAANTGVASSSISPENIRDIVGTWIQESRTGEFWSLVGQFRVVEEGEGDFKMTELSRKDPQNDKVKITNLSHSDGHWTFDFDRGEKRIANFSLTRKRHGVYYGWSSLNGVKKDENRWIWIGRP